MDVGAWKSDEVRTFWRYISSSLSRLVDVVAGMEGEGLNWRPSAPSANSVGAIALHMLANAEGNILGVLCAHAVHREPESEFKGPVSRDEVLQRWADLEPRMRDALGSLEDDALHRNVEHPRRGRIGGRDVLIVVARHAAEHLGQAELTRDLWLADRTR